MKEETAHLDRVCGALLGTAAGDALGAGYEFATPRSAFRAALHRLHPGDDHG